MDDTEPRADLASMLLDLSPADVIFWSGAGISGDTPTCGPLGATLTSTALREGFEEDLPTVMQAAYEALGVHRTLPRLESVLDVSVAEYGVNILRDLLAPIHNTPPNANHRFFAEHTALGGMHVTANFDNCIEQAGADPSRVIHFHGRYRHPDDLTGLGARLSTIERGFDQQTRQELDEVIDAARAVIVAGYSGLDYFDVDPYWRDAAERGLFEGRQVIWLHHTSDDVTVISGPDCKQKQLLTMRQHGAEVHELHGATRVTLDTLARRWSLPAIPQPRPCPTPDARTTTVRDTRQQQATTRFFVHVGLRAQVRRRLEDHASTTEEHGWLADAYWGAGRYRQAADHWALAHPGNDSNSITARREREAACLWLQGRLRKARRLLTHTMADTRLRDADPQNRLLLAETLGRVLVHMRRLPDTRLLVPKRSIRAAADALDAAERAFAAATGRAQLPVHLRTRAQGVREALTGERQRPGTPASDGPVRDFDEYEALGAMLNYRHASLRARVEIPRPEDGGRPAPIEYERLRDSFRIVGDTADAARVPLLPGAATVFPFRQVLKDLHGCDFSRYHLLRLTGLHLFQRGREARAARNA